MDSKDGMNFTTEWQETHGAWKVQYIYWEIEVSINNNIHKSAFVTGWGQAQETSQRGLLEFHLVVFSSLNVLYRIYNFLWVFCSLMGWIMFCFLSKSCLCITFNARFDNAEVKGTVQRQVIFINVSQFNIYHSVTSIKNMSILFPKSWPFALGLLPNVQLSYCVT